jgi:MFS family permease
MNPLQRPLLDRLLALWALITIVLTIWYTSDSTDALGGTIIFALIIGLVVTGLFTVTALLLNEMLATRSTYALRALIALALGAIAGVIVLHVADSDPEVAMWSFISIPYLSGIVCAGVLALGALVALALRMRERARTREGLTPAGDLDGDGQSTVQQG